MFLPVRSVIVFWVGKGKRKRYESQITVIVVVFNEINIYFYTKNSRILFFTWQLYSKRSDPCILKTKSVGFTSAVLDIDLNTLLEKIQRELCLKCYNSNVIRILHNVESTFILKLLQMISFLSSNSLPLIYGM